MDVLLGVLIGLAAVASVVGAVRLAPRSLFFGQGRAMQSALHAATVMLPDLRRGLTTEAAQRAAPHLRTLTQASAIALTDRAHVLAFDENIVSLRATYQFTRFIFARGRIDFDSIASNVKGQFLFGWTPNPGTAFYAGYNDDFNRRGFSPFTGQLEPGLRRNGRTFFIKMSYLFRKSFG